MPPKTRSYKKRLETKSVRIHHLLAAVTRDQKRRVMKYCRDRKIAISEFLAAIMLREARYTGKPAHRRPTITLPFPEHAKIEYLAGVRGITVEAFVAQMVQPIMHKQKASGKPKDAPKPPLLRYYLSNEEHEQVIKYLTKHNLSARHFAGLLAVRHVDYVAAGRKETRNYPWNKKA